MSGKPIWPRCTRVEKEKKRKVAKGQEKEEKK